MSCCRISGSLSFNSRLTSAAAPLGSPGAYPKVAGPLRCPTPVGHSLVRFVGCKDAQRLETATRANASTPALRTLCEPGSGFAAARRHRRHHIGVFAT
jgi:hypothetical protein